MLVTAALALVRVARTSANAPDTLAVRDGERLLVIAPHPDDETLGAGGLIQRVLHRHGTVHVVLMTAGDGNVGGVIRETGLRRPPAANFVAYGARRVAEARAALHTLGVPSAALDLLGFPDGGLMPLLSRNWRRAQPAHSKTTGASDPPYDSAIEPNIEYDGTDLRDELVRVLREVRPTLIALPDPVDHHPDHGATGAFAILAIDEWIGSRSLHHAAPRVVTYLIHWPDWPPKWDASEPDAADANLSLDLPSTLPERPLDAAWLVLSPEEIATKRSALAQHVSQERQMGAFLAAFVRRTEPFTRLDMTAIRAIASDYEREPEQQVKNTVATDRG